MHLFRSKLLVVVTGFVLLATICVAVVAGRQPGNVRRNFYAADSRLTVDVGQAFEPQFGFTDSGQELGGAVESSDVALGDFDGDGDLDAIVASFGESSKVYLNQGGDQGGTEGVFLDSGQSLTQSAALDVELLDLDGDDDLDAFLVRDSFGDSNEVWLNQGRSTAVFSQTDQVFGDDLSSSVALGDLDGANGADAFVSRYLGRASKVWFNDGSGAFVDSGQALDTDSNDLAMVDLDGDDDLDAFSANSNENKVWVNQGGAQMGAAGSFLDSGQVLSGSLSLAVDLGDLDGDDDLDAWVGNALADKTWVNQGGAQGGTEGVFLEGASTSGSRTRDVALGDLDGDGDLDAFLAKGGGNVVSINQGGNQGGTEGVFLDSSGEPSSNISEGVALGDVDGDGDLDVFVANWGQPDRVWLNQAITQMADVSVTLPPSGYDLLETPDCPQFEKTFNVTVHNAGPSVATNVIVSTDNGEFLSNPAYNFGSLVPGESADVPLYVYPRGLRQGPVLCVTTARVDVTADQTDAIPDNNSGYVQHTWYTCNDPNGCVLSEFFCDASGSEQPLSRLEQGLMFGREWLQQTSEAVIDLLVYQLVRDGVLVRTGDGRHYIDLFYTHNPEIQSLLDANPSLEAEALATLKLWQPNLWALVRGEGDSATITTEQVAAVDNFLSNLAAASSVELQQVIAFERDRLPPPQDFVGMKMDEARGLTVGYGTFLPMIADP
jgi:hypothetical protein